MRELSLTELKAHLQNLPRLSDRGRSARIKRAITDFRFAVDTYFSHHIEYNTSETSKFRKLIYRDILKMIDSNRKMTFEAYRGAAKTTLITRLSTLWLTAIRKQKRHVSIISSTIKLSKKTLDFIKTELEENTQLVSDFEITIGDKWTEEEIIFNSGTLKFRIIVYGAGTKIRGENWLSFRPDLIICDDIENDENVRSREQRDKLEEWFKRAIMKLPSRQSTSYNIILVGTKLHHDSLLSRIQTRADFVSHKFPLVLKFPNSLDTLDKHHLSKSAPRGMVLDDPALDAMELLREFLEDKNSFMSEFQNQPISSDNLIFGGFHTYRQLPFETIEYFTFGIDPALGKTNGDYFAITVLAYDRTNKIFYASTKMYKIKATLMIDKIISTYKSYAKYGKPIKIAVETVQFQEFFKDILRDKAKEQDIHLPIVPIKNNVAKELRIDSISPLIDDGTIRIDETSRLLIDELQTYPLSAHDDGLDSLEMAYRIAKKPDFDYAQARANLEAIEAKNSILKRMLNK